VLTVAFSGGKDSTAMALRYAELGVSFQMLHTATGNELPAVRQHIERVRDACGVELVDLNAPTLAELIEEQGCLPNWRMRWCTRMIKIEPCIEWLRANPDVTLAVGLRADEEGRAGGIYEGTEVVYPLREWGWNEADVRGYCLKRGYVPPKRTDCAVCFFQTVYEWYELWRDHPEMWAQGEEWERVTGFTFRGPNRDTWPARMKDLAQSFAGGRIPKPRRHRSEMCRICAA